MCGRFTQLFTWAQILELLRVSAAPGAAPNVRPRYNIAPTTTVRVIINRGAGREFVEMSRGLIPALWSKKIQ
jgi:putative SOS response-associated peptidase YedK